MVKSFVVRFNGTAAIPHGSKVEMLVDNPDQPTAAFQINFDGITYTREELGKEPFAKLLAPPNFIYPIVEKVTIYSGLKGESVTDLTISI